MLLVQQENYRRCFKHEVGASWSQKTDALTERFSIIGCVFLLMNGRFTFVVVVIFFISYVIEVVEVSLNITFIQGTQSKQVFCEQLV